MRVGITGTRHEVTGGQFGALRAALLQIDGLSSFHHGDCVGADQLGAQTVRHLFGGKVFIVGHPPKNDKHRAFYPSDLEKDPEEYLDRNKAIVSSVDLLLVVPKENQEILRSGTWATVRYARAAGVPRLIFYP